MFQLNKRSTPEHFKCRIDKLEPRYIHERSRQGETNKSHRNFSIQSLSKSSIERDFRHFGLALFYLSGSGFNSTICHAINQRFPNAVAINHRGHCHLRCENNGYSTCQSWLSDSDSVCNSGLHEGHLMLQKNFGALKIYNIII